MNADELPTYENIRATAQGELGDVLDGLRSDWRPGTGPNPKQGRLTSEAKQLIAQARTLLDRAAAAATDDGEDLDDPEPPSDLERWPEPLPWLEDDEDPDDDDPDDGVHRPVLDLGRRYRPWLAGDDIPPRNR